MSAHPLRRGFQAGLVAGLALLAAMYLAAALAGLRPLPQLLQEPFLQAMPGPVFGFLIDTLQHVGKVVEEAGLLAAILLGLGLLGTLYAWFRGRRPLPHLALLAGAAGWLVVCLVALPLSGDGPLGLVEGPSAPLLWALLFAVYGLVLQLTFEAGAAASRTDEGRRRLLRLVPLGIAALGLGTLGVRLLPAWYEALARTPESGLSGPSPELTPVGSFYVVSKNFSDPVVSEAGWFLNLHGLVERPRRLDLADLRGLPAATEYVTLECVSNNVGGGLMSTGSFTGARLRDLVQAAGPRSGAAAVAFRARDGYTESIPLSLVLGAPEILVAYALDGAPLPASHGFPARILIPGHYGMKGPKWLEEVELVGSEVNGYWENQGWDRQAVVKTTARLDVPRDGSTVKLAPVQLAGVAFAGSRGIQAVEWSADGARSWNPAAFDQPLSALTWVVWRATWTPPREGAYALRVRARDGGGALQTGAVAPSFPSGASGYHTIHVNVGR